MRILALIFGCFLLLLLCVMPAGATNYVYHNGYYWYGNTPYYRTYDYYHGGYSYGYYYSPGYYYSYYPVPNYQPPANPNLTPSNPNWRTAALDVLKQQQEAKAFNETMSILGAQGSGGSYGGNYNQTTLTPQGSSALGYSLQNVLNAYGDNSVALGMQALNRATENQQSLAGAAVTSLNATVNNLGDKQAQLLSIFAKNDEIRAKLEGAANIIKAAQGQGITITTTQSGGQSPAPQPAPVVTDDKTAALIMQNRCASCHSGQKAQAGFRVENWASYNADQKMAVRAALVNPDATKRMPLDGKGNHTPLPDNELSLLLSRK